MSDQKKENLFAKLAQQSARTAHEEATPTEPTPPEDPPPSPAPPALAKPKSPSIKKRSEATTGRRANPDYCQANAYVLKSVRRSVDRALLDMDGMDYSTLVEELLIKWLKTRRVSE